MSLKTPELRESLKAFILEARQCADPEIGQLKFERFRLHGGRAFEISDRALQAQNDFVRQAIKKLGPIKGHAKVLDGALWDIVVSVDEECKPNSREFLNSALEQIETTSASVCEFFRPCPLIRLPDGVDRLEIGRVAIDKAEARINEFRELNKLFKFGVGADWSLSIIVGAEEVGIVTKLPPVMWSINLAAADPVREEEALWLTDVALTLLRMSVARNDLGTMAPTVGKVEPHPFFPYERQDNSFALKQDGGGTLVGMTAPNDYRLSTGAVESLRQPDVIEKINTIFEAKPKSVAERFYQGCGWLTRGRRSKDRSDRLLYFFTAIESLLSDSDKTSPVIQTIARHAAVLLNDDNEKRQKVATDIKQLYGVRSALVHAGSRGAFDIDANSAQQVAELLFMRVWHDVDLKMKHQDFSNVLGDASYGLPPKF